MMPVLTTSNACVAGLHEDDSSMPSGGAVDAAINDEGEGRALLQYIIPLSELAGGDLYSALKSCTQG